MDNVKAKETLTALQKLKVDCLYKKSTHFNAARRLKSSGKWFQWLLIGGTIFASFSTIMNVGIWDEITRDTKWIQIIINILGALGGFLILYTTAFSDYNSKIDTSIKHENVANELNLIFKRIRNTEANYKDGLIDGDRLNEELSKHTDDFVAKCNSAPITKDEDYAKARKNFKKGFTADYTDKELNC